MHSCRKRTRPRASDVASTHQMKHKTHQSSKSCKFECFVAAGIGVDRGKCAVLLTAIPPQYGMHYKMYKFGMKFQQFPRHGVLSYSSNALQPCSISRLNTFCSIWNISLARPLITQHITDKRYPMTQQRRAHEQQ